MKLLEVNHLHTYFKTGRGVLKAVNDVSFSLDQGEALGIVGESGCGKTTAALSICHLLPKEGFIHDGEILLEGKDLVALSQEEIRKHRWKDVSMIFQGAMNAFNPVLTIGKQISEVIVLHEKVSEKEALERTKELLDWVEIPRERHSQYPHEFSGGMKQRAMIAMALACSPKIIIGDEPTTALDVMVQAQILNLLEKLRKETNMGMILITHDLSILGETCDKIGVMYAGKMVEIGSVDNIFKESAHPYTKRLIGCFPNINGEKVVPKGIDGFPPDLYDPPSGCPFHPRCDYVIDICREEMPPTIEIQGDHKVACHRWEDVIHGK